MNLLTVFFVQVYTLIKKFFIVRYNSLIAPTSARINSMHGGTQTIIIIKFFNISDVSDVMEKNSLVQSTLTAKMSTTKAKPMISILSFV